MCLKNKNHFDKNMRTIEVTDHHVMHPDEIPVMFNEMLLRLNQYIDGEEYDYFIQDVEFQVQHRPDIVRSMAFSVWIWITLLYYAVLQCEDDEYSKMTRNFMQRDEGEESKCTWYNFRIKSICQGNMRRWGVEWMVNEGYPETCRIPRTLEESMECFRAFLMTFRPEYEYDPNEDREIGESIYISYQQRVLRKARDLWLLVLYRRYQSDLRALQLSSTLWEDMQQEYRNGSINSETTQQLLKELAEEWIQRSFSQSVYVWTEDCKEGQSKGGRKKRKNLPLGSV